MPSVDVQGFVREDSKRMSQSPRPPGRCHIDKSGNDRHDDDCCLIVGPIKVPQWLLETTRQDVDKTSQPQQGVNVPTRMQIQSWSCLDGVVTGGGSRRRHLGPDNCRQNLSDHLCRTRS